MSKHGIYEITTEIQKNKNIKLNCVERKNESRFQYVSYAHVLITLSIENNSDHLGKKKPPEFIDDLVLP